MDEILLKRSMLIKRGDGAAGNLVYWMSRDQRVDNNWALIYAMQLAVETHRSLAVVFCLVPEFLNATIRQYGFMLKGLQKVELKLRQKNIPFYMLLGNPEVEIPKFCLEHKVGHLVADFDPLRIKQGWLNEVCRKVNSVVTVVDAHNVVPAFLVSRKAEYGAYTLRPKINRMLPLFFNDFPEVPYQTELRNFVLQITNWNQVINQISVNREVKEVSWCVPGEDEALKHLHHFLTTRLNIYGEQKNDPTMVATSNLSPYLHFGQISAQHIAREVLAHDANPESKASFLEELIIRRELADNFCYYNPNYDSVKGFPDWAKRTLNEHKTDKRDFLYSSVEFESASTHDELWNAAQKEMMNTGKMHGFMRMYWAKKILEWSATPEEALNIAIFLNDKYELDGRDPNGYVGCAWAIGGVHDRAWNKHQVYGMIRYMNYNGCKRKFNVSKYIEMNKES